MLISRSNTSTNPNSTDRSIPAHPSLHLGMGANLFEGGCSFRVWTPNAIGVSVCIWRDEQISQVSLAPEPSNPSYWSVDVTGVVANKFYQFLIENKGGDATNPGGYEPASDEDGRLLILIKYFGEPAPERIRSETIPN